MLDVEHLKIGVMVGLFIMAVIACVLPFLVSKYVKNTVTIFSVMNCLSGGVVLGAALSHMMPSANDNFASYFEDKNSFLKDYPLTPAITAFGLLLLLTIDRTLLSGEHSHSEVRDHSTHNSHKYNKENTQQHKHSSQHYYQQTTTSYGTLTPETPSVTNKHGSQNYSSLSSSTSSAIVTTKGNGSQKYQSLYTDPSLPLYSPSPAEQLLQDASPRIDVGFNTDMLNKSISDYNSDKKTAAAKTWVFLLALSVHSVLEGLGMGAEDSEDSFFSVLFAVLAHKCLEAFALGLSIFYAKFSRTTTILMILGYSAATPLGVLAGMLTASLSSSQNLMAGILVSLAAGSFLYISMIEILPTELHKPHVMGVKLFAMIFGWAAMVILAYYV